MPSTTSRFFSAFDSAEDGALAAGDDRLHLLGVGAEGGRKLGRIEHAEPPARAGADVEQPPAAGEPVGDEFDRFGDRLALRGDGIDGDAVLRVHQRDSVGQRHGVEVHRLRESLFGQKMGAALRHASGLWRN
jgi:hypothetical protein